MAYSLNKVLLYSSVMYSACQPQLLAASWREVWLAVGFSLPYIGGARGVGLGVLGDANWRRGDVAVGGRTKMAGNQRCHES